MANHLIEMYNSVYLDLQTQTEKLVRILESDVEIEKSEYNEDLLLSMSLAEEVATLLTEHISNLEKFKNYPSLYNLSIQLNNLLSQIRGVLKLHSQKIA